MQYRLDLVLVPAEGALLRVIGMAERRGFAPRAIVGAPNAADDGPVRRRRCAARSRRSMTAFRCGSARWSRVLE